VKKSAHSFFSEISGFFYIAKNRPFFPPISNGKGGVKNGKISKKTAFFQKPH
jgi:hypothetical protein